MPRNNRGVTLVELIVSMVIMSIGVLGLIGALAGLQKGFMTSKGRTLSANLTQEQLQILKQKNYYQVIPTADPLTHPVFTDLQYDNSLFPPDNILEGGLAFTRYTLVQVVEDDSGVLQTLPATTPDTGMRLLTVSTVYQQDGVLKRNVVRSILSNPEAVMSNAFLNGTVTSSLGGAVSGALINVAENVGWRDTTNGTGGYAIGISPGNFTLTASAPGFFTTLRTISIGANATQTQDFTLLAMSSGSVVSRDYGVWLRDRLLISQVVVSSVQAGTGFEAQFVELFNPTTQQISIATPAGTPLVKLKFRSGCSAAGYVACESNTYGIKSVYTSTYVAAGEYYLWANTGTFTVNGVLKTADAVFADDAHSYCNPMPSGTQWTSPGLKQIFPLTVSGGFYHGGTFYVANSSNVVWDALGITHTGNPEYYCETNCFSFPSSGPYPVGQQYVRRTSTGATDDYTTNGRAYDSDNTLVDITSTTGGIIYPAYSMSDSSVTTTSGRVPRYAVASANDGLSDSTMVYVSTGSPPYAAFSLTRVATGTWTVIVASGTYLLQHDTVTVVAQGSVFPFPSTANVMNRQNSSGFISGRVLSVLNTPISAPSAITLNSGSGTPSATASTVNGRYLLAVSSTVADIFANPSNANTSYISQSSMSINVGVGEIVNGVDFYLSQGGRITGFVTRDGTNALPGVAVTVADSNGNVLDTQVSASNGRFTTLNIATGTYTVELQLGSQEVSSPTTRSATVTSGNTVFSATFTVSGALGYISGSVSLNGSPLRTGTLILASTTTVVTPPALSSNSLTGASYFMTSSKEDGTYTLEVTQSTNPVYRVYAYYTTVSSTGAVTITPKSNLSVSVTASSTTSGVNFSWP